jgi:TPR repeat protein
MFLMKRLLCLLSGLLSSSAVLAQTPLDQGLMAFDGKDYARSLQLLRPFAEQGNCKAQFVLGYCYQYGLSVVTNDSLARQWLNLAALQKYPRAMGPLAVNLFQNAANSSPRRVEAYYWAVLAAEYDPIQRMTSARMVIKNYLSEAELQAATARIDAQKQKWQPVAVCQ